MGIWNALFGSADTVNKISDGIYDGLDAAIYTDEEKAKHKLDKTELAIRLLKVYEPFKLAQRLLALLFSIPFVLIGFLACVCFMASLFIHGASTAHEAIYSQLKTLIELDIQLFGQPCSIILGFYFLGGAGEGMIKAWVDKNSSKK